MVSAQVGWAFPTACFRHGLSQQGVKTTNCRFGVQRIAVARGWTTLTVVRRVATLYRWDEPNEVDNFRPQ